MNLVIRAAIRSLPTLFEAKPIETRPPDPTDDAGLQALRGAIAKPPPREIERAKAVLIAGGLSPEDAVRIVEHGIDAETATDLLKAPTAPDGSRVLLHPSLSQYGPAVATISILTEAQQLGALSSRAVMAHLARLDRAVVLRPDGYLVPVLGGPAIETRPDLELGQLYHLASGVIRKLGPDGPEGAPIAELGLKRSPFLDGVEQALFPPMVESARQLKALLDDPENTLDQMVDDLRSIPGKVWQTIKAAPEILDAFRNASSDDQVRFLASTLTQAYLVASALSATASAWRAQKNGLPLIGAVQIQGHALAFTAVATTSRSIALTLLHASPEIALAAASAVFAESLDLHPSADTRIGPTTIADPKHRHRVRDRIERALGNARDPDVPFEVLLDHLELAPKLGDDAVRELKAMILERIKREVHHLDGLHPDVRAAKVRALRNFADKADLDIRDALRNPAPPPPRTSLSRETQKALKAIDDGKTDVHVSSRAVAEEVLSQYRDYVDTGGRTMGEIKELLGGKDRTYHWDEVFGEGGTLIHHDSRHPHATKPHLQLHRSKRAILRIFFPKER